MLHRIPFPDPVQFSKIAKTSEIPAGIHKNFPDDFHAPPLRTNNVLGRKCG